MPRAVSLRERHPGKGRNQPEPWTQTGWNVDGNTRRQHIYEYWTEPSHRRLRRERTQAPSRTPRTRLARRTATGRAAATGKPAATGHPSTAGRVGTASIHVGAIASRATRDCPAATAQKSARAGSAPAARPSSSRRPAAPPRFRIAARSATRRTAAPFPVWRQPAAPSSTPSEAAPSRCRDLQRADGPQLSFGHSERQRQR